MDPQQAQQQAMHAMAVMLPIFLITAVIVMAIIIIPLWQICKKAGLAGPISLLSLIPGIGLFVVLYVIAFTQWKVAPVATLEYPPTYPPPPAYPPAAPPTY